MGVIPSTTSPRLQRMISQVVPNYERIVLFRLGRIRAAKGPGLVFLLPVIDQWQRVDLRTRAFSVPPCKVLLKDGAQVSVGADIQFRIWNPALSVVAVQDLNSCARITAQNAVTHTLLKKRLREIQTDKLRIGEYLAIEINDLTKAWGLEVDRVELILEAVLKPPEDSSSGPLIMPPAVPGMEGLAGPIQQLAMHFLSNSVAATNQSKESCELVNEEKPTSPSSMPHRGTDELVHAVGACLSEALVSKVQASYQFNITDSNGLHKTYFLDLTKGIGSVSSGVIGQNPDVTLEVVEEDLQAMLTGDLRPLGAYMSGRLQVRGDLQTVLKLEEVIAAVRQQSELRRKAAAVQGV
ncbi:stomatin-like protein 1 isoform X2 [Latimeria chalumnae]|uniref:stomatin-like protein 1 isoform X2 n=1 Tax=Latimeria chalumnae TaxID=7897 RepID=UPI00313BC241